MARRNCRMTAGESSFCKTVSAEGTPWPAQQAVAAEPLRFAPWAADSARWALTIQREDPPLPGSGLDIQTCVANDPNYPDLKGYEQAWHEAYRDVPPTPAAYERSWFGTWWLRDEFTP